MNREEYLQDSKVNGFIEWLRLRVSGKEVFVHSYFMRQQKKSLNFRLLWDAYCKYEWRGNFEDNQIRLGTLRKQIRCAMLNQNNSEFVDAVTGILAWGGVTHGNVPKLKNLGDSALPIFDNSAKLLNPKSADTSQLGSICHMNSGWTKVYSLMLEEFPIYDSRVGAALSFLVRKYCLEKRHVEVPKLLRFRYMESKSNSNPSPNHKPLNRNPSADLLEFPRQYSSPRSWAESNVWAAWVLGEVKGEGEFGCLEPHLRLRALEAALFMIGYEIPGQP